ncbi:MAG: hypothetical protein DSZ03_08910 [Sulfurimonas sp.]|nr:MAG: hypothetical protein DSZ03_08910 [Sulfurimonas sp.]
MSTHPTSEYDTKLESVLEQLRRCQQEHQLSSCSLCQQYLACELRKEYVKVVYESMSKGDTGGFEF